MINAEIILEHNLWGKKIKNPKIYIKKRLNKLSKSSLFKLGSKSFTILLTNNKKMKYLNNKFRNKNKTTDVLSFPFWNSLQLKKNKKKKLYLGDIAINYQFVKKRSKLTNFQLEFDKIWIHGLLHLLGYNHKKNKDFYQMNKIENKISKYFCKIN